MHESIAKEDIPRCLLANENRRETLTKAEQLGSALSDNVVSLIIRPVKSPNCKIMQEASMHMWHRRPRR